jgi:hypothetical protein
MLFPRCCRVDSHTRACYLSGKPAAVRSLTMEA